ncbi:cupin domain-containing protein [Marinomonas sp. 2405UD68-3]|uniref:cupin domain-containing protein n=1 Tax=Marinomonas sp. 2405UD68-3 TaxID=3391835 RepID=UPI0039C8F8B1
MAEIIRKVKEKMSLTNDYWNSKLLAEIGSMKIRHRIVCGKSSNLHQHDMAVEAFFILEGTMVIEVEGEKNSLVSGDFVKINSGEKHRIIVDDVVSLLVIDNINSEK